MASTGNKLKFTGIQKLHEQHNLSLYVLTMAQHKKKIIFTNNELSIACFEIPKSLMKTFIKLMHIMPLFP